MVIGMMNRLNLRLTAVPGNSIQNVSIDFYPLFLVKLFIRCLLILCGFLSSHIFFKSYHQFYQFCRFAGLRYHDFSSGISRLFQTDFSIFSRIT